MPTRAGSFFHPADRERRITDETRPEIGNLSRRWDAARARARLGDFINCSLSDGGGNDAF